MATDITLQNACNAAFHELGLAWCWDASHPLPCTGASPDALRDCVRDYLTQHQAHMLRAYDADFLVDAIIGAMARCAPGSTPTTAIDWRELQQPQIGI
jgi:hypothetical protein